MRHHVIKFLLDSLFFLSYAIIKPPPTTPPSSLHHHHYISYLFCHHKLTHSHEVKRKFFFSFLVSKQAERSNDDGSNSGIMIGNNRGLIAKERQWGGRKEIKFFSYCAQEIFAFDIRQAPRHFFCVASLLNIKLQSSGWMEREQNFHFSFIVILVAAAAALFKYAVCLYVQNRTEWILWIFPSALAVKRNKGFHSVKNLITI